MQPVALSIPGSFYDSCLIGDRLFLISATGLVSTYSWSKIVKAVCSNHREPLLNSLLKGSDTYVKYANSPILNDPSTRAFAKERLRKIADTEIIIDASALEEALIAKEQLPLEFPYASLEIVDGVVYVAGSKGVFGLSARSGLKNLFSSREPTQYFDRSCFHMSIGWDSIVASAGEQGLWDLSRLDGPESVYKEFVTRHGWIGASLYAHSPETKKSALLVYTMDRELDEIILEEDLFGDVDTSWGEFDRICGLSNDLLTIRRVTFESLSPGPTLQEPVMIELNLESPFVSGANSSFGTVIETENELVIIDSEYEIARLSLQPVNWRLYKRGKYNGFMSVALEDKMMQFVFPDMWFPTTDTLGQRSVKSNSVRLARRAA